MMDLGKLGRDIANHVRNEELNPQTDKIELNPNPCLGCGGTPILICNQKSVDGQGVCDFYDSIYYICGSCGIRAETEETEEDAEYAWNQLGKIRGVEEVNIEK